MGKLYSITWGESRGGTRQTERCPFVRISLHTMSNSSDEANEAIEKKRTRDREKIAEKRKRAREHSSPQELDEQRRKHANAQRHTTLWDAIYNGDLSLVVWLIEIIGVSASLVM